MDEQSTYIPSRLDEPFRFLWLDWDVTAILTFFFVFGLLSEQMLIATPLGIWIAYLYSRAKAGRHRGILKHMLYWFIGIPRFRRSPPSHFREFIG